MRRYSSPKSWDLFDQDVTGAHGGGGSDGSAPGGGQTSTNAFFAPVHYAASYQYPLVVYLHGPGNNQREVGQVFRHVSLRNFVAVGVRGNRATDRAGVRFDWSESSSAIARTSEAIFRAIDEAKRRYSIHPGRIILAGYRSGGTMALRQALMAPNRFAAAVSLGGTLAPFRLGHLNELRQRRMPMFWQWAADNPEYDTDRLKQDLKLAMMIRAKVEVRQYPTDDEMDTVALSHLNDWLMDTVVSGQPSSPARESREVEYSVN